MPLSLERRQIRNENDEEVTESKNFHSIFRTAHRLSLLPLSLFLGFLLYFLQPRLHKYSKRVAFCHHIVYGSFQSPLFSSSFSSPRYIYFIFRFYFIIHFLLLVLHHFSEPYTGLYIAGTVQPEISRLESRVSGVIVNNDFHWIELLKWK